MISAPDKRIELKPVVSYPRQAVCGEKYLITVELQHSVPSAEWPYSWEEYELSCMLDTSGLFTYECLGEPSIVVHRFGGCYEPASYLLTACKQEREGSILITLVNQSGLPVQIITLFDVRVARSPSNPVKEIRGV